MDPFQSRLMTRLSLKGLWRTISLILIHNSNAEINSSVYLDRCSSSFSIIHPSLVPSDISACFFWAEDRVQWPLSELNPNCLPICLIEKMSLRLDVIKSSLLLGSLVGVERRLIQSALTTDRLATLVWHQQPFLSGQFFVLCIIILAHLSNCCPSFISFMLMPMDEYMSLMDGSNKTHRRMSHCCSNVPTFFIDLTTLVFGLCGYLFTNCLYTRIWITRYAFVSTSRVWFISFGCGAPIFNA
jgi:hypothetical protein